ncbi:hypothetical protein M9Y10_013316 [Tritrichomonas musculus]|uniref:ABC transporter domain-containing protein n=1 Tax=Tritrichomonas musculus TaxID=1915356 RepID=A0ABR2GN58_9EUKA
MEETLNTSSVADPCEINFIDSSFDIETDPNALSSSKIFFKDLWKAKFRDKNFIVFYIIGLFVAILLIVIDSTSLNTIPEDKNPSYTYFDDPYLHFFIQVYSDNFLLSLAPKNSEIVNEINNFFSSTYNISFNLKDTIKEIKDYLYSDDDYGIGAYFNQIKSTDSVSKYDISFLKKSSPEYANLVFYLSVVKFISEKGINSQNESLQNLNNNDKKMKERSNRIEFDECKKNIRKCISNQIKLFDDNENNNSYLFNISSRSYSHPKMKPTFGYDSTTSFYIILAYFYISISSSVMIFKYNKEKILFFLNINGLSVMKMYQLLILCILLENVPITIVVSVAITFISKSLRGSNFLIVIISTILMALGRTFFNFASTVFFMNFNNFGIHFVISIMFPVIFMMFSMFKNKLPLPLFYVLSAISPSQSYMMGFSVMTICKEKIGSLSFSLMNTKFGGMSMSEVLGLQICNTIIMLLLMILFILNMKRLYGNALIGWKNMFKINYWKRLFNKSKGKKTIHCETNNVIKIIDLEKTYKGNVETKALNGVNCQIGKNEAIIMIGPNGCGKSTLINCIIGTIPVDSGDIEFFEENLDGDFTIIYDNLGIVFQDNVLINELTVNEHFELIGSIHSFSKEKIESYSNYLLSLLCMSDCKGSRASDLSGGQKRKLCISLAILHRPPLLIFDEPTAGVDAQSRQTIWKAISLFKDTTALITTHALEEAESICSRMFIMVKGQITFMGTPSELRKEADCGYILTVIEENPDININLMDNLLEFVRNRIPEAKPLVGKDKSIVFPTDLKVADLLEDIDNSKESLGIVKYTLSVQNIEESLVKLIQNEEVDQMKS